MCLGLRELRVAFCATMARMNDSPDVVERILDVVVYAPLGAVVTVARAISKLAERGRRDAAEATGALATLRDGLQRRQRGAPTRGGAKTSDGQIPSAPAATLLAGSG